MSTDVSSSPSDPKVFAEGQDTKSPASGTASKNGRQTRRAGTSKSTASAAARNKKAGKSSKSKSSAKPGKTATKAVKAKPDQPVKARLPKAPTAKKDAKVPSPDDLFPDAVPSSMMIDELDDIGDLMGLPPTSPEASVASSTFGLVDSKSSARKASPAKAAPVQSPKTAGGPRKGVETPAPPAKRQGPGRPRKATETTVPLVTKRGPGRPRKADALPPAEQARRGPGRPRKIAEIEPIATKRGPGRPRKSEVAPVVALGRGPGRPRKGAGTSSPVTAQKPEVALAEVAFDTAPSVPAPTPAARTKTSLKSVPLLLGDAPNTNHEASSQMLLLEIAEIKDQLAQIQGALAELAPTLQVLGLLKPMLRVLKDAAPGVLGALRASD